MKPQSKNIFSLLGIFREYVWRMDVCQNYLEEQKKIWHSGQTITAT